METKETKTVARKKPVDEVARLIEEITGMSAPVCRIVDDYYNPATPLARMMRWYPMIRHPHWFFGCCEYPGGHPVYPRLVRIYGFEGSGRTIRTPKMLFELRVDDRFMRICIDCALTHVKKYNEDGFLNSNWMYFIRERGAEVRVEVQINPSYSRRVKGATAPAAVRASPAAST